MINRAYDWIIFFGGLFLLSLVLIPFIFLGGTLSIILLSILIVPLVLFGLVINRGFSRKPNTNSDTMSQANNVPVKNSSNACATLVFIFILVFFAFMLYFFYILVVIGKGLSVNPKPLTTKTTFVITLIFFAIVSLVAFILAVVGVMRRNAVRVAKLTFDPTLMFAISIIFGILAAFMILYVIHLITLTVR